MVTHTRNLCSAFIPSKVRTHSVKHWPGAVGSHLCCGARGAVGGSVPCSRAPQSWYWGCRERCTFTPPTYNSCRTWDSQPFDYESDSLTIRPRLPTNILRSYEAKQSDCARNWTWFTPLSPRTTDSAKSLYCSTEEKCHLHLWWPEGESVNSKLSFLANIPSMSLELRVKSKL